MDRSAIDATMMRRCIELSAAAASRGELPFACVVCRDGEVVGSTFLGPRGAIGPTAASQPEHLPAILDHIERRAAELEIEEVALEVPMVNEVAMRHLLARGFKMDTFLTFLNSNRPFGQFDRFMGFSPPFIL